MTTTARRTAPGARARDSSTIGLPTDSGPGGRAPPDPRAAPAPPTPRRWSRRRAARSVPSCSPLKSPSWAAAATRGSDSSARAVSTVSRATRADTPSPATVDASSAPRSSSTRVTTNSSTRSRRCSRTNSPRRANSQPVSRHRRSSNTLDEIEHEIIQTQGYDTYLPIEGALANSPERTFTDGYLGGCTRCRTCPRSGRPSSTARGLGHRCDGASPPGAVVAGPCFRDGRRDLVIRFAPTVRNFETPLLEARRGVDVADGHGFAPVHIGSPTRRTRQSSGSLAATSRATSRGARSTCWPKAPPSRLASPCGASR